MGLGESKMENNTIEQENWIKIFDISYYTYIFNFITIRILNSSD